MQSVSVRIPYRLEQYEVTIGTGMLSRLGDIARHALTSHARRIALISNEKVFNLYGERAMQSLRGTNFTVAHWLMNDGERFKNIRTLEGALAFLSNAGLERSDAVVALGGGVVGAWVARLLTILYFAFFLLMPWYTARDQEKPEPLRVTRSSPSVPTTVSWSALLFGAVT